MDLGGNACETYGGLLGFVSVKDIITDKNVVSDTYMESAKAITDKLASVPEDYSTGMNAVDGKTIFPVVNESDTGKIRTIELSNSEQSGNSEKSLHPGENAYETYSGLLGFVSVNDSITGENVVNDTHKKSDKTTADKLASIPEDCSTGMNTGGTDALNSAWGTTLAQTTKNYAQGISEQENYSTGMNTVGDKTILSVDNKSDTEKIQTNGTEVLNSAWGTTLAQTSDNYAQDISKTVGYTEKLSEQVMTADFKIGNSVVGTLAAGGAKLETSKQSENMLYSVKKEDFIQQSTSKSKNNTVKAAILNEVPSPPASEIAYEVSNTVNATKTGNLAQQKNVLSQISEAIKNQAEKNIDSTFKIKLKPEGLGEVTVELKHGSEKIDITIKTELSSTNELVSEGLNSLKSLLMSVKGTTNYQISSLSLEQGGSNSGPMFTGGQYSGNKEGAGGGSGQGGNNSSDTHQKHEPVMVSKYRLGLIDYFA